MAEELTSRKAGDSGRRGGDRRGHFDLVPGRDRRRVTKLLHRAEVLAHAGSWEWNVKTGEVIWSENLFRIFGFSPHEVVPSVELFLDLVHAEDRGYVTGRLDDMIRGQGAAAAPFEFRAVSRDGVVRELRVTIEEGVEEGEERGLYLGSIDDLTGRRAREAGATEDTYGVDALSAAAIANTQRGSTGVGEHIRAITDSVGEGIAMVDAGGRLIYLNPAGEELLGRAQEELEGQLLHELVHPRHHDEADAGCPLADHGAKGPAHVEHDVFARERVADLQVAYTVVPFDVEAEQPGAVVVFRDTSARRGEEVELERRLESLSWIGRIRDSLARDRFVVHAQPIISLATEKPIRHEILIRMLDEDGSLVPPGSFLPVAEEFGQIREIDRWMLLRAAELIGRGIAVSLNLSAESIAGRGMIEEFRLALSEHDADPSLLVVELTETALLENQVAARRFADGLDELGCRLALDDFGTGYGGFTYLKRFRASVLKIDREFVRDLTTSSASEHVVRAVVSLAEGFGLKTTAEGVEDQRTLEALRDLGVDHVQGFHLARPQPLEEALGDLSAA